MARPVREAALCVLLSLILLFPGCTGSGPTIIPIEANDSPSPPVLDDELPPLSPQEQPQAASPPKWQEYPESYLKLEGIIQKPSSSEASATGAIASAWRDGIAENARIYAIGFGEKIALWDGTLLEVSSLNDNPSLGSILATYLIGGKKRSASVGQVAESGNWSVQTLGLFLEPEKFYASFLLSQGGKQSMHNLSSGGEVHWNNRTYEVLGVYQGFGGNYSGAVLSEGDRQFFLIVGEERLLPLE